MSNCETRQIFYIIQAEDAPANLGTILRKRLFISGTELKRLKHSGGILLNDAPAHTNAIVAVGDTVTVLLETDGRSSTQIIPVPGPVDLIYEDSQLLVVNKPPYTSVHPTGGHMLDSLANYVMHYWQQRAEQCVFRAVNRLDRNTSGVVVIAKSAYISSLLQSKAQMKKSYLALVHGRTDAHGTVDIGIIRPSEATIRRMATPKGAPSQSDYTTLASNDEFSLVRVEPRTGRTHQIRVHMKYISHPLAGDFLYGREEPEIIARHALHCAAVRYNDPLTGEKRVFRADLPNDMLNALDKTDLHFSNEPYPAIID